MQRSYGYGYGYDNGYARKQPYNPWASTAATYDYGSHLTRVEKMPDGYDNGYAPKQPYNPWAITAATHDYGSHLTRIEKMPSERERTHYPNVFKAFKNRYNNGGGDHQVQKPQEVNQKQHQVQKPQEVNQKQHQVQKPQEVNQKQHQVQKPQEVNQKQQKSAKHSKKVQMTDRVEIVDTPVVVPKDEDNNKEEEIHEGVDSRADGYIKSKRRAFELVKWKTFKAH